MGSVPWGASHPPEPGRAPETSCVPRGRPASCGSPDPPAQGHGSSLGRPPGRGFHLSPPAALGLGQNRGAQNLRRPQRVALFDEPRSGLRVGHTPAETLHRAAGNQPHTPRPPHQAGPQEIFRCSFSTLSPVLAGSPQPKHRIIPAPFRVFPLPTLFPDPHQISADKEKVRSVHKNALHGRSDATYCAPQRPHPGLPAPERRPRPRVWTLRPSVFHLGRLSPSTGRQE